MQSYLKEDLVEAAQVKLMSDPTSPTHVLGGSIDHAFISCPGDSHPVVERHVAETPKSGRIPLSDHFLLTFELIRQHTHAEVDQVDGDITIQDKERLLDHNSQ